MGLEEGCGVLGPSVGRMLSGVSGECCLIKAITGETERVVSKTRICISTGGESGGGPMAVTARRITSRGVAFELLARRRVSGGRRMVVRRRAARRRWILYWEVELLW